MHEADEDHATIAPESPFALMSDVEAGAWFAYMKVHLRLRYEMNRQLRADHNLSLADYDLLVALISDPDVRLSVTDLATRIGWERSRTSHQSKRMAERGLVTLTPDHRDRRTTSVSLTDSGRAALAAASPSHVDLVRTSFLAALDDSALKQLTHMMESAYDRIIEHGTLPRPADHP